ncbi:Ketobutyrate formate-lyase [Edwardsiella tarda]|nr:Ketobutyrate formate-lyase [Edwardsiella tarda]
MNMKSEARIDSDAWRGFAGTEWKNEINVRDFIQNNYTPYYGDESFLAPATPATTALWQKVMAGIRVENATHAPVDFDSNIATTITAHAPGYITRDLETIVGLQTDQPLKRALHPFGGINMIRSAFQAYGREMDPPSNTCSAICGKRTIRGYSTSTHPRCCAAVSRGS